MAAILEPDELEPRARSLDRELVVDRLGRRANEICGARDVPPEPVSIGDIVG